MDRFAPCTGRMLHQSYSLAVRLNTAVYVKRFPSFFAEPKKSWCSTRIVSHALPFIVILLQQTLKIKFVMEVITFESEAYKALVGKIEKIAEYVAAAQLPSEEKRRLGWTATNWRKRWGSVHVHCNA